jgi:large subunit ribosomal protein L6e
MVKKFDWYPADDEKKHYKKSPKAKTAKLRKSITAGSVLVLLAGRFRGRRVVFLKQLPSGLLLVTGPYKINGVPLKRVNQVYTLTTSTKVDLAGVDASKIDDDLFTKDKKSKKAGENKFFNEAAKVRAPHPLSPLCSCVVEDRLRRQTLGPEGR